LLLLVVVMLLLVLLVLLLLLVWLLVLTFEEIISKSKKKATRKRVPPGIYADYGFHLLQDGQLEKGMRMLEKEKELYPESEQMVNYLMSQFK
jgi:hypothetical protein